MLSIRNALYPRKETSAEHSIKAKMLKPFAHPTFNIIKQPFNSVQQNRMDVEANVEAVC